MQKLGKVGVYCHIEIVVFPVYLMELMVCFLIGIVSYRIAVYLCFLLVTPPPDL